VIAERTLYMEDNKKSEEMGVDGRIIFKYILAPAGRNVGSKIHIRLIVYARSSVRSDE